MIQLGTNILTEFDVPMKLIRLVKMYLNESCIKVWVQVNIFGDRSCLMMPYYQCFPTFSSQK